MLSLALRERPIIDHHQIPPPNIRRNPKHQDLPRDISPLEYFHIDRDPDFRPPWPTGRSLRAPAPRPSRPSLMRANCTTWASRRTSQASTTAMPPRASRRSSRPPPRGPSFASTPRSSPAPRALRRRPRGSTSLISTRRRSSMLLPRPTRTGSSRTSSAALRPAPSEPATTSRCMPHRRRPPPPGARLWPRCQRWCTHLGGTTPPAGSPISSPPTPASSPCPPRSSTSAPSPRRPSLDRASWKWSRARAHSSSTRWLGPRTRAAEGSRCASAAAWPPQASLTLL